jgi:hypothetical protein
LKYWPETGQEFLKALFEFFQKEAYLHAILEQFFVIGLTVHPLQQLPLSKIYFSNIYDKRKTLNKKEIILEYFIRLKVLKLYIRGHNDKKIF